MSDHSLTDCQCLGRQILTEKSKSKGLSMEPALHLHSSESLGQPSSLARTGQVVLKMEGLEWPAIFAFPRGSYDSLHC